MLNYKQRVKSNFNKAAITYDSAAFFQKETSEKLADFCFKKFQENSFIPARILDVGTGTGFITEALYSKFPEAYFDLCDLSKNMLLQAEKKFPIFEKSQFIHVDAEIFKFKNSPYDLIISNLSFQWFSNFFNGLENLWNQTSTIAFTTLLAGTFSEWQACHPKLMKLQYPTEDEVKIFCSQLSQKVFLNFTSEKIKFKNGGEFIDYLRKIGAQTSKNQIGTGALKQALRDFSENGEVTFNLVYGVIFKG